MENLICLLFLLANKGTKSQNLLHELQLQLHHQLHLQLHHQDSKPFPQI